MRANTIASHSSCQANRGRVWHLTKEYLRVMFQRALVFFSGFSHFFYGVIALCHPHFVAEFARYGFDDYRGLIGVTQSLLGLGLLMGFYNKNLKIYAALGLAIMMAGAVGTRIHIGDTFIQSTPAIIYLIINLFIFSTSIMSKK